MVSLKIKEVIKLINEYDIPSENWDIDQLSDQQWSTAYFSYSYTSYPLPHIIQVAFTEKNDALITQLKLTHGDEIEIFYPGVKFNKNIFYLHEWMPDDVTINGDFRIINKSFQLPNNCKVNDLDLTVENVMSYSLQDPYTYNNTYGGFGGNAGAGQSGWVVTNNTANGYSYSVNYLGGGLQAGNITISTSCTNTILTY